MEMDWRQRRTNGALFSILMVLVILVLVVGGVRYHQYRQAQQVPEDESVTLSADSAHRLRRALLQQRLRHALFLRGPGDGPVDLDG